MRTLNQWLNEYAESHTHPINTKIHKIFVPLIMFSLLGLLWVIPTPNYWMGISPFLNWASIFALLCMVFYIRLSIKYALGMLIACFAMLFILQDLHQTGNLLTLSVLIFVISWVFQLIGHKYEGKKPSFATDLVFLLIGPLWVLKSLMKKIGLES
jgi:uncharacterized membrane protein YGL010W